MSAPDFELPQVELPFQVQALDTPPPTQEELLAEYGEWWREQEEAKLELQSVLLDVLPGSGEVKGLVQAFAGEDLVTGRKLHWWEIGLNIVSALPLIHEGVVAVKLLKSGGALGKVAHIAHDVHKFNRVIHTTHAIKPLDVLTEGHFQKEIRGY